MLCAAVPETHYVRREVFFPKRFHLIDSSNIFSQTVDLSKPYARNAAIQAAFAFKIAITQDLIEVESSAGSQVKA
jgi:hypothetical protein